MKVIGLFAGIGGIEYGLHQNGVSTIKLCEIMPEAQNIICKNFPDTKLLNDVCKVKKLPKIDILTAGFPCQNLSIAGDKSGLSGEKSALVYEIFRIIEASKFKPDFIVIENVANIISLNKGEALALIVDKMNQYGYEWAYRLADPRSFGIPQRRPRFIFVASKKVHPKYILFPKNEDVGITIDDKPSGDGNNLADSYGFYWTEGKIGIGWAKDSIPPLKCGSTLGLPSAPAIWDVQHNFLGTPSIEDAERLQGFPEGWTEYTTDEFKGNSRWKLLGNAVNTRVSNWVAQRIMNHQIYNIPDERIIPCPRSKWAKAAFSDNGKAKGILASYYPEGINYKPILEFLQHPLVPLSLKATLGFYNRVCASTLIKYPKIFKESIRIYLQNQYNYDYQA